MAFSESAKTVIGYLQKNDVDLTLKELADKVDMPPRKVNGTITAMTRKGYMERVPMKDTDDQGNEIVVKIIKLTDEGKKVDLNQE